MDTDARLPALFLSHGSPLLAIQDSPAGRFLDGLADMLPTPRAIVVASAHFLADRPSVEGRAQPPTLHDFGAFADELFRIDYRAPGSPALAARIVELLGIAGLDAAISVDHGFDHGVWVPLRRMYPQARVPVVPIAILPDRDAATHYALGRALAPLGGEGVLVIGSGGLVHNLGDLDWRNGSAPMPGWAAQFAQWMRARLDDRDIPALLDWRARAPHAERAHPTAEHLMPLFVALGAAGAHARTRHLHESNEMGSLALDAFAFG